MKNEIIKKTIVIGLIALFIGAGVTSGVDVNIEQNYDVSEKPLEYGPLNSAWIQIDDPEIGYIYIFKMKIPQLVPLLVQLQVALVLGNDMFIEIDWSGDIEHVYFKIENQLGDLIYDGWDDDSSDGFSIVFEDVEPAFYDMLVEGYDAGYNLIASHDVKWQTDWCAIFIPIGSE